MEDGELKRTKQSFTQVIEEDVLGKREDIFMSRLIGGVFKERTFDFL